MTTATCRNCGHIVLPEPPGNQVALVRLMREHEKVCRHPMQYVTKIKVVGTVPKTDPHYGWVYDVVCQVSVYATELREEFDFDGIRTYDDGRVHLTLNGTPVCRAYMSSHHADATLVLGDPE